jgi:hypothetical protein
MGMHVGSKYVPSHIPTCANFYVLDIDERETVQIMQRVCTRLLNSGLSTFFLYPVRSNTNYCVLGTVVKRRDIRINYTNFGTAIKEKLGIDLRGWPESIPFQSPTSINDHTALLKLRDALKDGSCHWFRMSPRQREDYSAHLAARRKKGEVIGKPRKKRSDAGVQCKGKENGRPRKRARGSGSSAQALKSSEFVDTFDEEDRNTSEDDA